MSNSIWKKPDVKPKNNNDIVCMVGDMFFIGSFDKYQGLYKSRSGMLYDTDEIDRWGYLEDIIAQADKAERLLEIAEKQNDILQDHFATLGYSIGKEVMDMYDEINN